MEVCVCVWRGEWGGGVQRRKACTARGLIKNKWAPDSGADRQTTAGQTDRLTDRETKEFFKSPMSLSTEDSPVKERNTECLQLIVPAQRQRKTLDRFLISLMTFFD